MPAEHFVVAERRQKAVNVVSEELAVQVKRHREKRRKRREALERLKTISSCLLEKLIGQTQLDDGTITCPLRSLIRETDRINYGVVQPGSEIEDGVPLIRVENVVNGVMRAGNSRISQGRNG